MDKSQALRRAMSLCSQKEYSEHEIRAKLKFWEVAPGDAEWVVGQLKEEKFIDDLRFAKAYALDKVRLNHWGRIKIRYMLSGARISSAHIDLAIAEIDEGVYSGVLKELLGKKSRELARESDPNSKKQKLIRFAQGRGFEVELILRLLKEIG